MFLSRHLHKAVMTAAAVIVAVQQLYAAKEPELLRLLPRHSAIVVGADISALLSHRQSALFFDGDIPVSKDVLGSIDSAVYSCDSRTRRSTFICRFSDGVFLERLRRSARIGKSSEIPGVEVYQLKKNPAGKRPVRVAVLADDIAGVYCDYPEKKPFELHREGIDPEISAILPDRKGIMLCGAGVPQMKSSFLSNISEFDFALEPGFDDKLCFHGKIVCRDSLSASLVMVMMPGAVSLIMHQACGIPVAKTLKALNSLKFRQKETIVYFSGNDISAVAELSSLILQDLLYNRMVVSD